MQTLGNPQIEWGEDGMPRSGTFGDVYFSVADGLAESRHVFLDGAGLPAGWRGRHRLTIGETGFGTGLNFLLVWQQWRQDPQRCAFLHYVSVEGFPLSRAALAQALALFPALAAEAAELLRQWPEAVPGFHTLSFEDGRVTLLLLFGAVEPMLAQLSASVDVWFLDGFAPARNPEMWSPQVLARIAVLSAPGARLATFTAAGQVRRDLQAVGVTVERRPGFGHKRECLAGVFSAEDRPRRDLPPWLDRPGPLGPGARVAVIGAGIGGCCAARALRRAGFDPILVDRHGATGQEASGNPCGLLKPRVTLDGGIHARFYGAAFRYMRRLLGELGEAIAFHPGILTVARDASDAGHLKALAATLPDFLARWVEPQEAATLAGVKGGAGGLWMPDAGAIRPPQICAALRGDIPLHQGMVTGLVETAGGWQLAGVGLEAEAVVIAAGPQVPTLLPQAELPIRANRGQITLVEDGPVMPAGALSFGGYVSPRAALDGVRVVGATYARWGDPSRPGWDQPDSSDDEKNLALAQERVPLAAGWDTAQRLAARSSLRATIADHIPMVGPAFSAQRWRQLYDDLHHGRPAHTAARAEWIPGLYVLGALGSRGFQTAGLLAETLAALCSGAPLPLEADLYAAACTNRFVLRDLRQPPQRRRLATGAGDGGVGARRISAGPSGSAQSGSETG